MKNEDNVLLFGFGTQATEFINCIKKRGYYLTASDLSVYYHLSEDQATIDKIDEFIEYVDLFEETFFKIGCIANKKSSLKAIICTSDKHVVPCALLQEKLGLKGPGIHAAILSTNKALQRNFFRLKGIPVPKFTHIHSYDAKYTLKKLSYPLVLKPINSSGSHGVKLVVNYEDAYSHINELDENGSSEIYLAEEFIRGEEFSVETLVQNGEVIFTNITKKIVDEGPMFVERGHIVPYPDLEPMREELILQENARVIKSMGIKDSIVHLEGKMTKNHQNPLVIIEVAVRMPGDRIMELIEYSTGVNLYEAYMDVLTSEGDTKITLNSNRNYHSASVWFIPEKEGQLISISGLKENQEHIKLSDFKKVGERVNKVTSSYDRLGYCLLSTAKIDELYEYIRRIENSIIFDIG